MSNAKTVTHIDVPGEVGTVRTTILFPSSVWKEVKKAAIDADQTASDYVIGKMAQIVGAKVS